jgi:hypothetical protein
VRLGAAIRKAETTGIAWSVDEAKPKFEARSQAQALARGGGDPAAGCVKSYT